MPKRRDKLIKKPKQKKTAYNKREIPNKLLEIKSEYLSSNPDKIENAERIDKALLWFFSNAEQFDLDALASSHPDAIKEQAKERAILYRFLDEIIVVKKGKFNEVHAKSIINRLVPNKSPNLQAIHAQSANLGVVEKYQRGSLDMQHWLTDLDISQTLQSYKLQERVKVSELFNPVTLRETIRQFTKDKKQFNKPYSLGLILNKGGNHWIAGLLTINPEAKKFSYKIDDSFGLDPDEKVKIQDAMNSALAFQRSSPNDNPFEKDWTIDKGEISGQSTQTDCYSCGYRALKQVISDLKTDESSSDPFLNTKLCSSEDLVLSLYNKLLYDKQQKGELSKNDFQPKEMSSLFSNQFFRETDSAITSDKSLSEVTSQSSRPIKPQSLIYYPKPLIIGALSGVIIGSIIFGTAPLSMPSLAIIAISVAVGILISCLALVFSQNSRPSI